MSDIPIRNVLTDAGKALITALVGTSDHIIFTQVKVGKGDSAKSMTTAQIALLTDIETSLGLVGSISKRTIQDNAVTVSAQFVNTGLQYADYVNEIGVFAKTSASGSSEIMFSYMSFGDFPDLLLGEDQATVQRVYDIPFVFDGASEVEITISASAIITEGDTTTSGLPASSSNAGKVVKLNSAGKLEVDITGDANTLDGHDSTYFATAGHDHSDAYVGENSSYHGFMSVADKTSMITMTSQINNAGSVQNVTTAATPTFVGLNLNGGYINGARFS